MKGFSKFDAAVAEIQLASKVEIELPVYDDSKRTPWVRFHLHGALSKLPSSTNRRRVGVSKRTGKSFILKEEIIQAFDVALTNCYQHARKQKRAVEYLDYVGKVFVHILLADSCSKMDAHNVDKFVCDWLQKVGVIKNDKNVLALAMPKSDIVHDSISAGERKFTTVTAMVIDSNLLRVLTALTLISTQKPRPRT